MRTQVIRTAPSRILLGTYLTAKGIKLKNQGATKKELEPYTKNRYGFNPESKIFKEPINLSNNPRAKSKTRRIKHVI